MSIEIISPPSIHTVQPNEWFSTFFYETSSLSLVPLSGGSVCYLHDQTLVVGSSEQECLDYLENNNIEDRTEVWIDDLETPYNIASSNGYGNTADPLNLNRN
jgi:hypothetical protein